jgi:hypothetical protein
MRVRASSRSTGARDDCADGAGAAQSKQLSQSPAEYDLSTAGAARRQLIPEGPEKPANFQQRPAAHRLPSHQSGQS